MTDSPANDRPRIEPEPPHPVGERRGLSPRVLALIALAVILALIAIGAGAFRDRIAEVIGPPPPPSEAEDRRALQARVAQLESELELARRQATRETQAVAQTGAAPRVQAETDALEQRIAALETTQARVSRAAAAAVAAGALADAAQGSAPFVGELAALERLAPTSRGIRALRPLAEQGAPTRAALAGEFPAAASRAARAARGQDEGSGFLASLSRAIGSIFSLRRIGGLEGEEPDAVLARAERRVDQGDLEGALAQLQSLPAPARQALADWTARAERRVEIERRVNALRSEALGDLSGAVAAETGAPL